MPVYEYQCEACGVRFERQQHVNDEPAKACPECGSRVRRLFQPVGIIFKGKGFYVTDHRGKSPTATSGEVKKPAEKSEESKPSGGNGAKSE